MKWLGAVGLRERRLADVCQGWHWDKYRSAQPGTIRALYLSQWPAGYSPMRSSAIWQRDATPLVDVTNDMAVGTVAAGGRSATHARRREPHGLRQVAGSLAGTTRTGLAVTD